MDTKKGYIFVRHSKGVLIKVYYEDITHIRGDGDYCRIFVDNDSYHIYHTLIAVINILPQDKFYRCHRSFIVNTDRIETVENDIIHIGRNTIPVGGKYKDELLNMINFVPTNFLRLKKDYKKSR